MAGPTAQALARELGARLGDYWLLTATGGGSTTTLVDTQLPTILPQTQGGVTAPLAAWVYGTSTAAAANRGVQRRVQSYSATATKLTFLTAWPTTISTGDYELHKRFARDRKLAALNSGVRQLGWYWARQLQDATITTATNQWRYTLPSTVPWHTIDRIQLQVNTDPTLTSYPYVDAEGWNVSLESSTDGTGVTTWALQFGTQPPPGRLLRVWGEMAFVDLVADADVLPLDVKDAGAATEWLYAWAVCQLYRWESLMQPQNQTEWLEKQVALLLKEGADLRDRLSRNRGGGRLILPGQGTGEFPANAALSEDPSYLAAFGSPH